MKLLLLVFILASCKKDVASQVKKEEFCIRSGGTWEPGHRGFGGRCVRYVTCSDKVEVDCRCK